MFNDEEVVLLTELVEDKITHYRKLLNEARWAGLATTETYLAGRLSRLQGISEKLTGARKEEPVAESAPDESLASV